MKVPDIIIAIDGFSSTGKSTLAKLVSDAYSFLYLDSGALYRGVTLFALEHGMTGPDGVVDTVALLEGVEAAGLSFRQTPQGSRTYMGSRCVEDDIRTLEVSAHVSPVSAIPAVREFVDRKLHGFGACKRVVMDGRDIGTTVFPDAELKIFMVADDAVRARRRFEELRSKGQDPVYEDVLRNIQERDYMDSHREVSPLTQASDAFVLDNSGMTLHEELIWVQGLIQGRFNILTP